MTQRKRLHRILIYLLLLAVSVVILYLFGGGRSLTAEMAFRRKEKQNMVGPSQILQIMDFEDSRYDHLLVAKSDYGYIFFEWNDSNPDNGILTYQPKSNGATLYCTKYGYESTYAGREWLPVFAFAGHPSAVRAVLTLETTQKNEDTLHQLEAARSEYGYFLFQLKLSELKNEDFWLFQQLITGQYREYELGGTAQAILELYNTKGELVQTYQFTK